MTGLYQFVNEASRHNRLVYSLVVLSPKLRKWRNWQTRKPQELVPHKGVGVRIPPSAPLIKPVTTGIN